MTGFSRLVGPPPATTTPPPSTAIRVAATAAVLAGLLHFAVVPEHRAEWWAYGVFFTAIGGFQLIWAAWVWVDHSRWTMLLGFLVNIAVLALWVATRTGGLPFGPEAGSPESVGVVDVASSVAELLTVVALAHHRQARRLADAEQPQVSPPTDPADPTITVTPKPAP